jgi:hypothetical protein
VGGTAQFGFDPIPSNIIWQQQCQRVAIIARKVVKYNFPLPPDGTRQRRDDLHLLCFKFIS